MTSKPLLGGLFVVLVGLCVFGAVGGLAEQNDDELPIVERSESGDELLITVDCDDPQNESVSFEIDTYESETTNGEHRSVDGNQRCVFSYPLSSVAAELTVSSPTQNVTITDLTQGQNAVDIRYIEFREGTGVTNGAYEFEAHTLGYENGRNLPAEALAGGESVDTEIQIVHGDHADFIRFQAEDISEVPLLEESVELRVGPDEPFGPTVTDSVDLRSVADPQVQFGEQVNLQYPLLFDGELYEIHVVTTDPTGQYATIDTASSSNAGGSVSMHDSVLFAEHVEITVARSDGQTVLVETLSGDELRPEVYTVNATADGAIQLPDGDVALETIDTVWINDGSGQLVLATDVEVTNDTITLRSQEFDEDGEYDVLLVSGDEVVRLDVHVGSGVDDTLPSGDLFVFTVSFLLGGFGVATGLAVTNTGRLSPLVRQISGILGMIVGPLLFVWAYIFEYVTISTAVALGVLSFALFAGMIVSNRGYTNLVVVLGGLVSIAVLLYTLEHPIAVAVAVGVGGVMPVAVLQQYQPSSRPLKMAVPAATLVGITAAIAGVAYFIGDIGTLYELIPIAAAGVLGQSTVLLLAAVAVPVAVRPGQDTDDTAESADKHTQVQQPASRHTLRIRTIDKPTQRQIPFNEKVILKRRKGHSSIRGASSGHHTASITNGEGSFTLGSGTWDVTVGNSTETVTLDGDRELTVPLSRTKRRISVRGGHNKTASATDQPSVTQATVRPQKTELLDQKSTNEYGTVTFEIPAHLDTVEVIIDHEYYDKKRETIPAVSDPDKLVVLEPTHRPVELEVLLDGEPVKDCTVAVEITEGPFEGLGLEKRTDVNGTVRFNDPGMPIGKATTAVEVPLSTTDQYFTAPPTSLGTDQTRETIHLDFEFELSHSQQRRIDRLRKRIDAFDSETVSDPTIQAYFANAVGSFVDAIETIPQQGLLFFESDLDPNRVVDTGLNIADAGLDAVETAMSDPQCVDFFAACDDLEPAYVRWGETVSIDQFFELYRGSDDQRFDQVLDHREETKSRITAELRELSEVAPAETMHSQTTNLIRDRRGSDDITEALTVVLGSALYLAIKDMFNEEPIRRRMSRTVF